VNDVIFGSAGTTLETMRERFTRDIEQTEATVRTMDNIACLRRLVIIKEMTDVAVVARHYLVTMGTLV